MDVSRDYYLNQLIVRKNNGLVKIITGLRRCGKSYLLFKLYKYSIKRKSKLPKSREEIFGSVFLPQIHIN